ncbi:hypothetical protein [Streptomyces sp. NPDC088801]|uniref:hypothetical protein n=1 Tax=Streptomyces sp. NPDC088801 TaxID=3365903 RepID=UPI0038189B91
MASPRRNARSSSQNVQLAEDAINRTLAKAPPEQGRLADGRETKTVLIGMVREWEEIRGGSFECHLTGSRWAHLSDDSLAIGDFRPFGLSTDLCAISDHAMARTFASGYRKWVVGNAPPVSFWSTVTMLEDVIPVMLAILDRELTGAMGCLDWYLRTPCWSPLSRQHPGDGDTPVCGSPSCALAAPETPCDCGCAGVNHGMGVEALQALRPEPPDWSSAPAPVWHPGAGTVEVDRTDGRVAGRDPFGRHGAHVRPPSSAWTSPAAGAPRAR